MTYANLLRSFAAALVLALCVIGVRACDAEERDAQRLHSFNGCLSTFANYPVEDMLGLCLPIKKLASPAQYTTCVTTNAGYRTASDIQLACEGEKQ